MNVVAAAPSVWRLPTTAFTIDLTIGSRSPNAIWTTSISFFLGRDVDDACLSVEVLGLVEKLLIN